MARKAERARARLEALPLFDIHLVAIDVHLTPRVELQLCFNASDVAPMVTKLHNAHDLLSTQVLPLHLQALPKSSTSREWQSLVFQVSMDM